MENFLNIEFAIEWGVGNRSTSFNQYPIPRLTCVCCNKISEEEFSKHLEYGAKVRIRFDSAYHAKRELWDTDSPTVSPHWMLKLLRYSLRAFLASIAASLALICSHTISAISLTSMSEPIALNPSVTIVEQKGQPTATVSARFLPVLWNESRSLDRNPRQQSLPSTFVLHLHHSRRNRDRCGQVQHQLLQLHCAEHLLLHQFYQDSKGHGMLPNHRASVEAISFLLKMIDELRVVHHFDVFTAVFLVFFTKCMETMGA